MFILISGGAGSGKSAFAEQCAVHLGGHLLYLATMHPFDGECDKRIDRHRAMRQGKGFETVERERDLEGLSLPASCTILLEDLPNWVANEYFSPEGVTQETLLRGIDHLSGASRSLVVVSNELFSDGVTYPQETQAYLDLMASLNCALAKKADAVYEVVAGMSICHKGGIAL